MIKLTKTVHLTQDATGYRCIVQPDMEMSAQDAVAIAVHFAYAAADASGNPWLVLQRISEGVGFFAGVNGKLPYPEIAPNWPGW